MIALGLHLHDRGGKRIGAEHPQDQHGREQIQREAQHDQRHAGIGAVEAAIEPHRDEPQHGDDDEHQHEPFVRRGLALARGEAHALGK